jgi:hypothetical protein
MLNGALFKVKGQTRNVMLPTQEEGVIDHDQTGENFENVCVES